MGKASPFISRSSVAVSGALSSLTIGNAQIAGGSGTCLDRSIELNASASNNLFGKSSTNQPSSLRSLALIRAY